MYHRSSGNQINATFLLTLISNNLLEEEQKEMKKKLLSVLLSTAMIATLLVGCGEKAETVVTPEADATEETVSADAEAEVEAEVPADTGTVLNIYCWNEEFQSRVKDHYPDYVDNGDGTGKIGDVTVTWTITPSQDNAYQNKLDETLLAQADAAADEKIDLFLIEADYALKYVNSDYTMDVKDLGLTDEDLANQYQYTKDIVTNADGAQKGTTWQACPGLYIYRRSAAKEIFGSDDPTAVQAELGDWDKFNAAAEKVAAAGYKIVSGYDDSYRVFSNNVSAPWVQDGKIVIDDSLMAWVDQTKTFTEKGYNNKTSLWSDDWSKGAGSKGDVFGYFGPAWFIDFCLAGYTLDDAEAEAAVGNGTWGDWAACEGPQGYFWGGTWICAATGTDNANLVKEIMYTMSCDKDVMTEIVKADNDFVNNQPAMDEMAASGVTSAFLGGENVLEKFCAGVTTIDMSNISGYDQGLNEEFQAAMKDYFDGNVTKEEAVANFQKAAVVKYPELTY